MRRAGAAARQDGSTHPGSAPSVDESWAPPVGETFDLVAAATAWHWIDAGTRYSKAWALLRPGGHLAFWSAVHVFPEGGDPFFREIQSVYDEIGEGRPPGSTWPRPEELADDRAEVEVSGLFTDVRLRRFDWEVVYEAERYIDLLRTFSGHIAMAPWQRDRLFGEIRRRIGEHGDGRLRRHWGAVPHVARRVDHPSPGLPTPPRRSEPLP